MKKVFSNASQDSPKLNIVRFVNPIGGFDGDGEGVVRERLEDILIIDTGVALVEVPVSFVFDGFEFVPAPLLKATRTDKVLEWLKNNLASIGVLLGFLIACCIVTPLSDALVSEGITNRNSVLVTSYQKISHIMIILSGILGFIGACKVYGNVQTGKELAVNSSLPYLISALLLIVMGFVVKFIFI